MPRYIVKLANEEYIEWSTVVDAPVTYSMSREEMRKYLIEQYGKSQEKETDERLDRTDVNGTSAYDKTTVEELISANRAGDKETELTLEQIREQCKQSAKGK